MRFPLFCSKYQGMKQLLIVWACLCLLTAPVRAEPAFLPPAHGLAMHGAPKYADGFTHFDYTDAAAKQGGTLRLGVVGTYDSLNPFIVRGTVPAAPAFSLSASSVVYESLMARSWDEPFTLYGLLAQTVEVAQDRSSIIFHLDPRAHWQDGSPLTADDVLFSYATLRDQGRPHHRIFYKKVDRAQKVDERTVRFDFRREADGSVDREMPLIMGLMPVLPKHVWAGKDFNQTTLTPPVGSGPYKITNVDVGRSLTLERDPAYWGRDLPVQRGLYNFDRIRMDYYRDDSIALQAFKSGGFDLRRESEPKKWVKLVEEPSVREGRLVMTRFAHGRPEALTGFILNTRRPLFQDIRLRRAVGLAFDFDWINKALLYGLGKRTQSTFPNAELAASTDPGLTQSRREKLLQAAQDLQTAGYVLREGTLYAPTGEKVAFEIMLSDPAEEKIALEWGRGLKTLGIEARVRTVDSAQFQARLSGFDYDVTTGRWFNSLSPGNEQINFWGCASARQKGSRNYAGVCDPAIDALAAAIPAAQTRADLVNAARALDKAVMDGAYVVPFYYLGVDPIAYWKDAVKPAAVTPVYGPIIEAWHKP